MTGCCPEQRPGAQLVINIFWDIIYRLRALPCFTLKDVTYRLSQKVLLVAKLCTVTTQKSKGLNCTTVYTWNPQNTYCLKIQAAAPALRVWLYCVDPNFVKLVTNQKHSNHWYSIKMSFIFLFDMLCWTEALCHDIFISAFNFSLGCHQSVLRLLSFLWKKRVLDTVCCFIYYAFIITILMIMKSNVFTTEFECCPFVFPSKRRKGWANHTAGEYLWTYLLMEGTSTVIMAMHQACQVLQ